MAKNNSKMVEAITPMNEDFAKWYTDICKKAELIEFAKENNIEIDEKANKPVILEANEAALK